jgi:hypothetical protein
MKYLVHINNVMYNFYIPLSNIKVDHGRLLKEVDHFIRPDYSKTLCYGLTTHLDHVNDEDYNFEMYPGVLVPPDPSQKTLPSGHRDREIIHWPKILENSYIQELSKVFCDVLGLENPRVRCSIVNGTDDHHSIGFHTDPVAPHRIHIALQSTPDTHWMFKLLNDDVVKIHQPVDGIPVLIETGLTVHDIYVPSNAQRIHLWYQFHSHVSKSRIEELKCITQ